MNGGAVLASRVASSNEHEIQGAGHEGSSHGHGPKSTHDTVVCFLVLATTDDSLLLSLVMHATTQHARRFWLLAFGWAARG
eukprot:4649138-Prymnesium_polylepis.1